MTTKGATLLERARNGRMKHNKTPIGPEDVDLAIAWVRGEVGATQVAHAYGYKSSGAGTYCKLAHALAAHIRESSNGRTRP